MEHVYDLVIVGGGPAGVSASIYSGRAQLDCLWIDKNFIPGGQIAESGRVDNYPGLPGIHGDALGEAFSSHAESLGQTPIRSKVLEIRKDEDVFHIRTKKQEFQAKTVICALGAKHRHLEIPGEEELAGSGVSYCATCDGAFFKGKKVCVIGGGNTACEDALLLAGICEKVYLIHRRDELRADRILQQRVLETENIEVLWNTIPVKILGEMLTEGITIENRVTGEQTTLPLDGVFVAVGMLPQNDLVKELVELSDDGYVIAGEDCKTSLPGLFIAGDLREKLLRQVVTAVSDGACAINSVLEYLR
ncbi:MAG: thioredoxin-disulfide reductase [Eubacteriales bacterium]|nr:thioredoxin-disulfide reductase [Eubacteriales bacterium]